MPVINLNVAEKHTTVVGTAAIVCGNSDYTLAITFDDEWAEVTEKRARFSYVRDGVRQYEDSEPFTGDTVAVPILSDIAQVEVGVYGGSLRTSTPASIPCERSILCGNRHPKDPAPEVYDRMVADVAAEVLATFPTAEEASF